MKNRILSVASIAGALLLSACVGIAAAESIKAVSEIAATNAVQNHAITIADLTTLSTDLAALPQTPLPVGDNKIIANVVSEALKHKAATPTDGAVVDALNGVLSDVMASHAPTPADGIAWANLQDAVLGMKKAVTLLQTP